MQSGRQQLASGFWSLVGPLGVALGDLNGNGFLDLATANEPSNTAAVMQGLGDGSFEVDTIYSFAGGTAVEPGGINLDGYRDSRPWQNRQLELIVEGMPLCTNSIAKPKVKGPQLP